MKRLLGRGTWKVRVITKDGIKEILINDVAAPENARTPEDVPMQS